MTSLPSAFKIGFLGAGQLARMSALQAYKLGVQVVSFSDRTEMEPLDFVTPLHFKGSFSSEDDLIEFANKCDVLTLENEFIDSSLLHKMVEKSGTPLYPSPFSFEAIENKWIEKETYSKAGIPVCPYRLIGDPTVDLDAFGADYGWPFLLKSSKGGYDGYGNETVHTLEEAKDAFEKLGGTQGRDILAEAFVPFKMELAVTVARSHAEAVVYPCVQSIQENHICKKVICPAPISESIQQKAQEYAKKAMQSIDAIGVFSFEFFLTEEDELLLNESAPRPHNSAHYTLEACITSQFENHIRAILDLPLGSTALRKPAAVMINLLGTKNSEAELLKPDSSLKELDAHIHVYGKLNTKVGRKMGHLTLLGEDTSDLLVKAEYLTTQTRL